MLETLYPDAQNTAEDVFVEKWETSNLLSEYAKVEPWLRQIWKVAHMTIRDVWKASGLTQVKLAEKLMVPKRTIEEWVSGRRCPAEYVKFLIAWRLGLLADTPDTI